MKHTEPVMTLVVVALPDAKRKILLVQISETVSGWRSDTTHYSTKELVQL